jgi:AcrR family transcriptional regulator
MTALRPVPRGRERREAAQPLSPRAAATVRTLLDASIASFERNGYHRANIDQIVALAGVSRGTFYKYFDDKLDVLRVLSVECEGKFAVVLADCPTDATGPQFGAELRRWLASFSQLMDDYTCVFRIWMEMNVADDAVQQSGARVGAGSMTAFRTLLRSVDRDYTLDFTVASIVLIALIERLPQVTPRANRTLGERVELIATFVERGLLTP